MAKELIFDIDGTLWNTTDVVAKAWNKAVRDSHVSDLSDLVITGERLKKEFGKPMDVIADNLFGPLDKERKNSLLKFCCEYEHEEILSNNDDLTYEGMRETLEELSKSHDLYIVSNCQKGYIELVIMKNNLEAFIKDFECFGNTLLSKGENIKLIMERNGLKDPVYIGDTIGDFEATKEAGIPFVFCEYGFGFVEKPDYSIKTIKELTKLF